jgi:hypothetical protein
MATGRLAHDEQVPAAPRGRIPANATPRERMARKLRTKPGRAAYARRKAIVEPVFGQPWAPSSMCTSNVRDMPIFVPPKPRRLGVPASARAGIRAP